MVSSLTGLQHPPFHRLCYKLETISSAPVKHAHKLSLVVMHLAFLRCANPTITSGVSSTAILSQQQMEVSLQVPLPAASKLAYLRHDTNNPPNPLNSALPHKTSKYKVQIEDIDMSMSAQKAG